MHHERESSSQLGLRSHDNLFSNFCSVWKWLNAVLWEEDKNSYLRNLIADIQDTLKEVNAQDVFIKRHNECFIDTTKIDCDAYEYKNNNPDSVRSYRGEYMIQYSWAFFYDEDEYDS